MYFVDKLHWRAWYMSLSVQHYFNTGHTRDSRLNGSNISKCCLHRTIEWY